MKRNNSWIERNVGEDLLTTKHTWSIHQIPSCSYTRNISTTLNNIRDKCQIWHFLKYLLDIFDRARNEMAEVRRKRIFLSYHKFLIEVYLPCHCLESSVGRFYYATVEHLWASWSERLWRVDSWRVGSWFAGSSLALDYSIVPQVQTPRSRTSCGSAIKEKKIN